MDSILTAIGSYGFPIIMCLILIWYIKSKDDGYNSEIKEMREELTDIKVSTTTELAKVTVALDNNTQVMTKLLERMEEK